jgi:hypothetical protein
LVTSKFTAAIALPAERNPPKIKKTAAKIPIEIFNFVIETLLWITCKIFVCNWRKNACFDFDLNIGELTSRGFYI